MQLAIGKPIETISALNLDRRAIAEPRRRIGEHGPKVRGHQGLGLRAVALAKAGTWGFGLGSQRIEPAMSTPPSVTPGESDNLRPPSSNVAARPERIPTAAPMMMSVA